MNAPLSLILLVLMMGFSTPPQVASPQPPAISSPQTPMVDLPQTKGETVGPFGFPSYGFPSYGDPFDDLYFEGVRAITIYSDIIGLTGMKIQYVQNDKFHIREHGNIESLETKGEFQLAYPEEYMTSVIGYYGHDNRLNTSFVSAVSFVTPYGRESQYFGSERTPDSTRFVLEPQTDKGKKIIGILGRSGERITSLGVHFGSLSPASTSKRPSQRSEIVSGTIGDFSFDNGLYDGVSRVTVRENNIYITYMRIEYVDGERFETREHGSYTNEEGEVEFTVDYPEEYITAISVSWTLIEKDPQVMGIKMMTSYSRYQELGMFPTDAHTYLLVPKAGAGPKLISFLGKLHQFNWSEVPLFICLENRIIFLNLCFVICVFDVERLKKKS